MEEVIKGFACEHGDSNRREMIDLVARACRALQCKPETIVSAVCYNLTNIRPNAIYVEGIDVEQWCCIFAVTAKQPQVRFEIQCDLLEHGFALLWEKAIERFPETPTAS